MRRAAKKDTNHKEITSTLQALGCWVQDYAALGNGHPDILVYDPCACSTFYVEIKSKYGKRNEEQIKWADNCPLPVYVLKNNKEAKDLILLGIYDGD
jgi:hypothetical protein